LPGSPKNMQERLQKWTAWFKELETRGHLSALGHPLENGGAVVKEGGRAGARRALRRVEGHRAGVQRGAGEGPGRGAHAGRRLSRCSATGGWSRSGPSGRCDRGAPDEQLLPPRIGPARLDAGSGCWASHHLALAEDRVQETLAAAVEVWAFRGVPDNPIRLADDRGAQPRASASCAGSAPPGDSRRRIGRQADAEGADHGRGSRWRT
jgi:hypothetical protein